MPQLDANQTDKILSISDACLITPDAERYTDLKVKSGCFADGKTPEADGSTYIQASGCYITPGLIDLQVNGGPECDLWADLDLSSLFKLRQTMARCAVTSFLPTLITGELEHLKVNLTYLSENGVNAQKALVGQIKENRPLASNGKFLSEDEHGQAISRMLGVHLEGPFLSPHKPGVHPPQCIQALTVDAAAALAYPAVSLVTLAAEQDPDLEAVRYLLDQGIKVSLGHSNATFEQANAAFEAGVTLMTHTFNALPPLHHRAPGAVGAALLDRRVYCCVIADGLHVDPAIVQLIIKIKGVDKTILVTDRAHVGTSTGGLVGSSLTLDQAVRNVVQWGIATFPEAVRMATINPARALGLDTYFGRLAPGCPADFVVWDAGTLAIKQVYIAGKAVEFGSAA